jgi:hypothetical protein
LHWLTDHGFALLTQAGATPRYAPQLLASGDHNLAATYQLAMPVQGPDNHAHFWVLHIRRVSTPHP